MTAKTPNQILDEAKDKFEHIVVVGLKANGKLDISTTIPTYGFCHHLMDRAKFELLIMEKANIEAGEVEPETKVEAPKTEK